MGEKTDHLSIIDGARRAVVAVRNLCRDIGMVQRLSDVGIREVDIPQLVESFATFWMGLANQINTRDVSREDVERVFRAAL
jgi:alcohol dehydrogenase class IV